MGNYTEGAKSASVDTEHDIEPSAPIKRGPGRPPKAKPEAVLPPVNVSEDPQLPPPPAKPALGAGLTWEWRCRLCDRPAGNAFQVYVRGPGAPILLAAHVWEDAKLGPQAQVFVERHNEHFSRTYSIGGADLGAVRTDPTIMQGIAAAVLPLALESMKAENSPIHGPLAAALGAL